MKKIPIVLMLIALGGSDLTMAATAMDASEMTDAPVSSEGENARVEVNKILEPALVFVESSVAGNRLNYKFMGAEGNLGLWRLYVADYDVWHYSQQMVEENLEALGSGGKPEWAREMADLSLEWKNGNLGLQRASLGAANQLVGNNPGVLYYAAQIRDNSEGIDNPSYRWVRGKLDYRRCAYSSRNLPHIINTCQVRVDTEKGEYVFEQKTGVVRDETDPYQTWEEEFTAMSQSNLSYWRSRINDWEGDAAEKEEILVALEGVKNTAEDTTAEATILAKVAECEELLQGKIAIYESETLEPEEPQPVKPEEPKPGAEEGGEPSDGGQGSGEEEKNGENGGNGGLGGGVTGPNPSGDGNGLGTNEATEKPLEVAVNAMLGRTADDGQKALEGVSEATEGKKAMAEAMQAVDVVRTENSVTGTEMRSTDSLEEVDVPKLRETKAKWGIWVLVSGGLVALVGALGLIWRRMRRN